MAHVSMTVNGKVRKGQVDPRVLLVHFLREQPAPDRHAHRLRHHAVRRLHRPRRRPQREVLHAVRGAGRRLDDHDDRGPGARRRAAPAAGRLLGRTRTAVRLLHAGHDHGGGDDCCKDNPKPSEREIREGISGNFCRCTGYQHIVNAIQHAAKEAEVSHGHIPCSAEARWHARQAPRGSAPDSRRAAPTSTTSPSSACSIWRSSAATSRTDASARSTPARRRRWKASKPCSPAPRSPNSWRRCRSARRFRRRTIARSPWTPSVTAANRSPSSWLPIATSRATPLTPSSSPTTRCRPSSTSNRR